MHDTDHTEFQAQLADFKSGALTDVDWLMMRTHVAECPQCQAELRRPELPGRAAPKLIKAGPQAPPPRSTAPLGLVILGVVLVVALVTGSVIYAIMRLP